MIEENYILFMKYILIMIVLFVVLLIIEEIFRIRKLKNKFDLITVKSINEKDVSLKTILSKINSKYESYMILLFSKIKIVRDYSKKYDRYSCFYKNNNLIIFVKKIEIGFLISLFYIILSIIEFHSFNIGIYLIIFILGSYIMEISLSIRLNNKNKEIKDGLYDAINIMNKCFKANKSIKQTIFYLVNETNGYIKEEFTLVLNDLDHGLSTSEAFNRLSKRNEIEELDYIAKMVNALSNQGGNINEFFNDLEDYLLQERNLEIELTSKIDPSKIILRLFEILPFVIVLIISLIKHNYYSILTKSVVGIVTLLLMISLYILYILIVNKIFKGGE